MESFVRVDGGVGRVIAASGAVVKFFENKSGGVVSSISDVLENLGLPRVYPINTPFLFEDKIRQGEYLEPEPYNRAEYYRDEKHLSQVFNLLLNGVDEPIDPVIKLTDNELTNGKAFVEKAKNGKKFLLLQPYGSSGGGATKCNCGKCKDEVKLAVDETYRSFLPEFTDKLVAALKDKYVICVVRLPHQKAHKDTISFDQQQPIRGILSLIPHADAIICCDSFLHHAAKALGMSSKTIVLWAGTNSKNLGYADQTNIVSKSKVEYEPMRIPHNHIYYVDKNKGSNNFGEDVFAEISAKLN